jgi:hypothetical protein
VLGKLLRIQSLRMLTKNGGPSWLRTGCIQRWENVNAPEIAIFSSIAHEAIA